jgi:predicted nucleic acid-binding protein
MTLVDTSSWIHQLRPQGDPVVRRRVETLLRAGDACWCPIIRVELWIGARGPREKSVLREYERVLPDLDLSPEVWDAACALARAARGAGMTCPAPDIIIAACARHYHCALEAADLHYASLLVL